MNGLLDEGGRSCCYAMWRRCSQAARSVECGVLVIPGLYCRQQKSCRVGAELRQRREGPQARQPAGNRMSGSATNRGARGVRGRGSVGRKVETYASRRPASQQYGQAVNRHLSVPETSEPAAQDGCQAGEAVSILDS